MKTQHTQNISSHVPRRLRVPTVRDFDHDPETVRIVEVQSLAHRMIRDTGQRPVLCHETPQRVAKSRATGHENGEVEQAG